MSWLRHKDVNLLSVGPYLYTKVRNIKIIKDKISNYENKSTNKYYNRGYVCVGLSNESDGRSRYWRVGVNGEIYQILDLISMLLYSYSANIQTMIFDFLAPPLTGLYICNSH